MIEQSRELRAAEDHVAPQTAIVLSGIRQMILDRRLGPGSRLPIERDLAAEFGTSRGSLREAVRALCVLGVLETRQGDGTYVTELSPRVLLAPMTLAIDLHRSEYFRHIQTIRRVLECEGAASAALSITEDDLHEAELIVERVEFSPESGAEYDLTRNPESEFHRLVARASGNPVLEALLDALQGATPMGRLDPAIPTSRSLDAIRGAHRAILAALRAHDPETARLRYQLHLLDMDEALVNQAKQFR